MGNLDSARRGSIKQHCQGPRYLLCYYDVGLASLCLQVYVRDVLEASCNKSSLSFNKGSTATCCVCLGQLIRENKILNFNSELCCCFDYMQINVIYPLMRRILCVKPLKFLYEYLSSTYKVMAVIFWTKCMCTKYVYIYIVSTHVSNIYI